MPQGDMLDVVTRVAETGVFSTSRSKGRLAVRLAVSKDDVEDAIGSSPLFDAAVTLSEKGGRAF
jgi:hypothetical protein